MNVAEVINAGTVTEGGTVIPPLLDDKVTTAPAEGALPFKVTVPVVLVPPVTVGEDKVML